MDEFEFFGNLSLGQYLPGTSIIHKLDARVKLAGATLLLVALVISTSLAATLFAMIILLCLTRLASVPLRNTVRSLRPIWPFIILMVVFQLLAFPGSPADNCYTLWQWETVRLTNCSLHLAVLSLLRLVDLVLLINLLSLTTSLNEIIHGVEHLLRPLGRLGLPAHELALIVGLSLQFVPLLAEEAERLMKAQAARGADFGRGRWGLVQRIRRMLPLLIPLFVNSLERSEDLAVAMESRCYLGSRGRTHWVQLQGRPRDYVVLFLLIVFSVILIVAPLP